MLQAGEKVVSAISHEGYVLVFGDMGTVVRIDSISSLQDTVLTTVIRLQHV